MPVPLLVAAGSVAKKRLLKKALHWAAIGAPVLLVGAAVAGLLFFLALQGGSNQTVPAAANGCVNATPVGSGQITALQPDQLVNAQTIVAVARRHNVPPYGWVIGVATALQESSLHNLTYGDRDSLGLFQQRAGWAPDTERLDPASAAAMFFTGGRGGQPGLLQIPNWQTMPIAAAAQAVQRAVDVRAGGRHRLGDQRHVFWGGAHLGRELLAGHRALEGIFGQGPATPQHESDLDGGSRVERRDDLRVGQRVPPAARDGDVWCGHDRFLSRNGCYVS